MAPLGNQNAVGNKGGRPSKYAPELGEELIKWMEDGYSLTAAAAKMGFHRDTLYEWSKRHPEFSDSVKRAKGLRLFKLESDLLAAPDGPTVTSRIFALKNADPVEWRDKQTVNHDVLPESPLAALARELSGTAIDLRRTERNRVTGVMRNHNGARNHGVTTTYRKPRNRVVELASVRSCGA